MHPDGEAAGNRKGGTRMLVSSFIGSNREFRAWLAMRTRNVVGLGGVQRKRKNRSKGERPNRCVVTSIIAQRKRDCNE